MHTINRILAVSDTHGENKKLLNLLKKAEYEPGRDLLIIVGDMIDRGKENLDCLKTCEDLRKNGAVLLKGNHEHAAQENIAEMIHSEIWRSYPSESFYNWSCNCGVAMYHEIKDLPKEKLEKILNFILTLPLYFSIGRYIFSHAGANVKKPLKDNTEDELELMNESFPKCPAYPERILVFGHVPTWILYSYDKNFKKQNASIWYDMVNKDKIGIDCGVGFGGRLAALELPSYQEFYV